MEVGTKGSKTIPQESQEIAPSVWLITGLVVTSSSVLKLLNFNEAARFQMPDGETKVNMNILMARPQKKAFGLTCKFGSRARFDFLLSGRYDGYGYNQMSFRDMSIQLRVRCHQPRKAHSRVPNQVGSAINPCHGIVHWDTCQPLDERC